MKRFLFFPIFFITCFSFAQNSKEIIGKPIKIGTILVAAKDFPMEMDWYEAEKSCKLLGKGWRLPNKKELKILLKNKKIIGAFNQYYWTSEFVDYVGDRDREFLAIAFDELGTPILYSKEFTCNFRAVKSL